MSRLEGGGPRQEDVSWKDRPTPQKRKSPTIKPIKPRRLYITSLRCRLIATSILQRIAWCPTSTSVTTWHPPCAVTTAKGRGRCTTPRRWDHTENYSTQSSEAGVLSAVMVYPANSSESRIKVALPLNHHNYTPNPQRLSPCIWTPFHLWDFT